MLETCQLAGYGKPFIFHKGKTYKASPATNLPDYAAKGLFFAEKSNGASMVISVARGECKIV